MVRKWLVGEEVGLTIDSGRVFPFSVFLYAYSWDRSSVKILHFVTIFARKGEKRVGLLCLKATTTVLLLVARGKSKKTNNAAPPNLPSFSSKREDPPTVQDRALPFSAEAPVAALFLVSLASLPSVTSFERDSIPYRASQHLGHIQACAHIVDLPVASLIS